MLLEPMSERDEETVCRFVTQRNPELFQAVHANDREILGTCPRDRRFLFIGVLGSLFALALGGVVVQPTH